MARETTPVWYFDFVSPFAYLQFERLRRERPDFAFQPRPVLLAALLKHWGTVGPAELPTKRTFTYRFVLWKARSLDIPLRFPPAHPFNPLAALRLCIAAGGGMDAVTAIFRHIWDDGLPGDTPAALAHLAGELGIDDTDAAVSSPDVKAALAANGEQALREGIFGVPTFVADGRLFWGLDATGMLFDHLAGPSAFEDDAMRALDNWPVGAQRQRN